MVRKGKQGRSVAKDGKVLVFVYYPLLLCGTNFAKQGQVPAAASIWLANAAMGVIALGLFRRLLRN